MLQQIARFASALGANLQPGALHTVSKWGKLLTVSAWVFAEPCVANFVVSKRLKR